MRKAITITTTVLKWLLIIFIFGMLLLNVTILIMRASTKDEMPQILGYSVAIVVSGSMSPAIETYDMVVVKKTDDYTVGDVITFFNESSYVTHRIISKTEDGVITKGDANSADDGIVKVEDIKGEVVLIVPKAGKAINYFLSPAGIAILFAVLVLVFTAFKVCAKKEWHGSEKQK